MALSVLAGCGSTAHVRVESARTRPATPLVVSFAVFKRAPTRADSLPAGALNGLTLDRTVGSRLALNAGVQRVYIYEACPDGRTPTSEPCSGHRVQYCMYSGVGVEGGGGCLDQQGFAQRWVTLGSWGSGAVWFTAGIVPDFVSKVTYDGRDIPIVNNAFAINGAFTHPLVVTTRDGDKTIEPVSPRPSTTSPNRNAPILRAP